TMSSLHFSAYIEIRHLTRGHCDTVNSLSFSPGGTHLASGGDDTALCIWNISRGQLLYRLLFDEAIDCVLWHPIHPETVIVGLSNGYMFQVYGFSLLTTRRYRIDLGARSAVFCFDYDSSSLCLAIGMGEEVHVTREVSQNSYDGDLILSRPVEEAGAGDQRTRPVAVKFHKNGTNVIASYMNHGVICWDTTTRNILWHMTMPAQTPTMYVGSSALNPTHRYIAVHNVANGIDLYNVGGNGQQSPRKTYRFKERPKSIVHLQVRFIHGGKALVSGTTTGGVLVWETGTGEALQ
ncbi:WD40 repeat-like protein, partial [Polyporus arcularius HHB13444]